MNTQKIKFIIGKDYEELESEINNWLKSNENITIKDILFPNGGVIEHAVIIYVLNL